MLHPSTTQLEGYGGVLRQLYQQPVLSGSWLPTQPQERVLRTGRFLRFVEGPVSIHRTLYGPHERSSGVAPRHSAQ